MSGTHLLEYRSGAAIKLIELTTELAKTLHNSTSRLPKKMSLEAQRLIEVEDRKTQLRKLDMIHDFSSLLRKLLPGIAADLGLEVAPILNCLHLIDASIAAMCR